MTHRALVSQNHDLEAMSGASSENLILALLTALFIKWSLMFFGTRSQSYVRVITECELLLCGDGKPATTEHELPHCGGVCHQLYLQTYNQNIILT